MQTFNLSDPVEYRAQIESLPREDLIDHAKATLGDEFGDADAAKLSTKQIVERLATHARKNVKPTARADAPVELLKQPRVRIKIHAQEGAGGRDDVTVQINGYPFRIKRDHEVDVPESVVAVLKDAVQTVTTPGEKPGTFADYDVQRIPFVVLGPAPRKAA